MAKYALRYYYDFEKAEAWLNEMAGRGWMMESAFAGLFRFSKGIPGEYIYRVELLPWGARRSSYLRFLEETGVEVVDIWVRWAVYRRRASEGAFEIYTDADSRIAHFRRVSWFLLFLCGVEWLLALMQGYYVLDALRPAGSDVSLGSALFGFFFAALVGLALFRAARRAVQKYRRLEWGKRLQA